MGGILGRWRNFAVKSSTAWPGNETVGYEQVRFPNDPGGFVAQVPHDLVQLSRRFGEEAPRLEGVGLLRVAAPQALA